MDTKISLSALEMIMVKKPKNFTGMSIARMYNKIFDCTYDYHMFSDQLPRWEEMGILIISGHNTDGMVVYNLSSIEKYI